MKIQHEKSTSMKKEIEHESNVRKTSDERVSANAALLLELVWYNSNL